MGPHNTAGQPRRQRGPCLQVKGLQPEDSPEPGPRGTEGQLRPPGRGRQLCSGWRRPWCPRPNSPCGRAWGRRAQLAGLLVGLQLRQEPVNLPDHLLHPLGQLLAGFGLFHFHLFARLGEFLLNLLQVLRKGLHCRKVVCPVMNPNQHPTATLLWGPLWPLQTSFVAKGVGAVSNLNFPIW